MDFISRIEKHSNKSKAIKEDRLQCKLLLSTEAHARLKAAAKRLEGFDMSTIVEELIQTYIPVSKDG